MKFTIKKKCLAKLDQDKLKQAIAALRSGKYEQHRGRMTDPDNPSKASCLMVIAQEVDGMPWEAAVVEGVSFGTPHECGMSLREIPKFALLCQNLDPRNECGRLFKLALLNDSQLTHPQIAELLETGEVET